MERQQAEKLVRQRRVKSPQEITSGGLLRFPPIPCSPPITCTTPIYHQPYDKLGRPDSPTQPITLPSPPPSGQMALAPTQSGSLSLLTLVTARAQTRDYHLNAPPACSSMTCFLSELYSRLHKSQSYLA